MCRDMGHQLGWKGLRSRPPDLLLGLAPISVCLHLVSYLALGPGMNEVTDKGLGPVYTLPLLPSSDQAWLRDTPQTPDFGSLFMGGCLTVPPSPASAHLLQETDCGYTWG